MQIYRYTVLGDGSVAFRYWLNTTKDNMDYEHNYKAILDV